MTQPLKSPNFKMKVIARKGFTLLEVMVSLVMLSVVGIGIFLQLNQAELLHKKLLYKAYAREVAVNFYHELMLTKESNLAFTEVSKTFGDVPFKVSSNIDPISNDWNLLVLQVALPNQETIYTFRSLIAK